MRLFTFFGLLVYTAFCIFLSTGIVLFAFEVITPHMISDILAQILCYPNAGLILTCVSVLITLFSFSFIQSVLGKIHREKYIAFNTSSGQISIALAAVEDLIKRLSVQVPEVKSLRPDVRVRRRGGIVVYLRIDLRSETNIVELTERLQDLVKGRIQDMLRGIDEPIIVKIHVAKIVAQEEKDQKKADAEVKEKPPIPFYGYGR